MTRLLGRRRAWLLLSQLAIVGGLIGMALVDPRAGLQPLVLFALVVAFASATQDIALDAYRIESAPVDKQAALAAMYQTGYRLAMIWAGAGVLWMAARSVDPALTLVNPSRYVAAGWTTAYLVMAASMLLGIAVLIRRSLWLAACGPRRGAGARAPGWKRAGCAAHRPGDGMARDRGHRSVRGLIRRYRWHALLLLALIAVYRISDVVMGIMANPFYVDMGYTKEEVATVTKFYGVLMTLAGAFIGGVLALRLGVMRVLMLGAVLSAASNLLFAWLATRGHDLAGLVLVISADNLSAGIASAAFIAYLSSLTNVAYSATQYALFSSVMLLLPKFIAGFSGKFVDAHGIAFFHAPRCSGCRCSFVWLAAARRTRAPLRSGLAVPVVEVGVRAVHAAAGDDAARVPGHHQILVRVRVLAHLGPLLRADRQVLQRRLRGVDDLVRVFGPRRNVDDVASENWDSLAGHPQRALSFEDDEHLLLDIVEVIGTAHLARRDDVDRGAEVARRTSSNARTDDARCIALVPRGTLATLEFDFVEVADQLVAQRFAHGVPRQVSGISASRIGRRRAWRATLAAPRRFALPPAPSVR
jgi:PAT family beta-lactamase induction signal transducer AmpG